MYVDNVFLKSKYKQLKVGDIVMLTKKTCDAIFLLNELDKKSMSIEISTECSLEEIVQLETSLITGGLLDRFGHLTRPLYSISLLEIILALEEGVRPVHTDRVEERIYSRYNGASQKLGVVNHMLQVLLSKITLSELRLVKDD